jgi:hypothetical protein
LRSALISLSRVVIALDQEWRQTDQGEPAKLADSLGSRARPGSA